jgi:hypothetical protein
MTAIRYRQFTGTKITISSHNEPLPNQVADPETEAANRPRVPVPLGRAYHLSNTCTRTHNPTTHTCKSTSVALQQSKTATESICTNTELGVGIGQYSYPNACLLRDHNRAHWESSGRAAALGAGTIPMTARTPPDTLPST